MGQRRRINLQIKHGGGKTSDALRVAIGHKAGRLESILPPTAYVEVDLFDYGEHHAGQKEAEVVIDIPGTKKVVRFRAHGETFLAALDTIFDKVHTDLTQQRAKNRDHHYKGQSPKEWLANTMNRDEQ